ncbi:MAG: hypothetical protein ACREXR_07830, partial [Gammaproteobacteria bacterium]
FSIETIKAEVWTEPADGIEVRVYDDTGALAACYLVEAGQWKYVHDDLAWIQSDESQGGQEATTV